MTPVVQRPRQGCGDSPGRAVQAPTLAPSSPQHGCPSHSLGLKPAGEAAPRRRGPVMPIVLPVTASTGHALQSLQKERSLG